MRNSFLVLVIISMEILLLTSIVPVIGSETTSTGWMERLGDGAESEDEVSASVSDNLSAVTNDEDEYDEDEHDEDEYYEDEEPPTIEELREAFPKGWAPAAEPDGEIFPALILALANVPQESDQFDFQEANLLGNDEGTLEAWVINSKPGTKVTLTVQCPELMQDSVLEGVMDNGEALYVLRPTILWKYEVLRNIKQAMPAHVVFTLTLDGKTLPQMVQRVRVRTINDCLYYDNNPDEPIDMNWMFAAFVNEDHPAVDGILQEALNTKIVDGFTGYQSNDPVEVYRQLLAIWVALRERGLQYSSTTTTAASSERLYSQHVRFLDESLSATQANCVDGSVLLASILRKISIEPFLAVTPTHCFLGFYLDHSREEKAFLETTCLGSVNPGNEDILSSLARTLPGDMIDSKDWRSFKEAIKFGSEEYKNNRQEFHSHSPDFQLIGVAEARARGIMPIPRP